jgi:NADH-quinone oxidoreductase subunit J
VSEIAGTLAFGVLAVVIAVSALVVVLGRDMLRMAMGLAAFLIGVAGMFLYFSMGLLAIVQVFVYVGGVLVLLLFAIMLLQRGEGGRPLVESRHDVGSLFVAGGMFALIVLVFWRAWPDMSVTGPGPGLEAVADALLGPMLPQFEAAGVLLLAALIAVLAVVGGKD